MKSAFKALSLFVILFLGGMVSRAAAAEWPAITADEKSMTSVPQQADAPAVILYREENTDDTKNFHTVYVRLKILTEAGRKYADVEIPVGRNPFTISQVSGRTVHADGSVIPLEDQPVDKIALRDHGVRCTSRRSPYLRSRSAVSWTIATACIIPKARAMRRNGWCKATSS